MKNIEILYEDNLCLIVNKPAGLAVQGGEGVKTSLDVLLAQNHKEGPESMPLLVHRLDKETSGVLLVAKGKEAAARFSKIISEKAVKVYTAICKGCPEKPEGATNEAINVHGSLKQAITKYKVIKSGLIAECGLEFSVIELELVTGRMHQIRRHLAMSGNPILGDDKYGDFTLNKQLRKTIGLKRLLLHASKLEIKGEFDIKIEAQLPEVFHFF